MALKKARVIIPQNGNGAERVFEHNLVKMGVPVLGIILLSIVSWLFTTVLEMDEVIQQHTIHLEHLHKSEEYIKYELKELDKTVTNIRIHVGKVTAH
tara:strand:- start:4936 stop:5226 length:291 start_codon:yes stop_codon:yes gene_type:complete